MARHVRPLLVVALVVSLLVAGGLLRSASDSASAAGLTYYVAKSGSDTTGNGSAATPWGTIQKAANTVSGGDVVHVGAGTYNERVTIPSTKSGSAGMTTRFVADGAVVVAQGFVVNSSYTDLTGFEITPGASGLQFRQGQVQIQGDRNTVSGFNVHDIVSGTGFTFASGASYGVVAGYAFSHGHEYGVVFGEGSDHNLAQGGTIRDFGGWSAIEMDGEYNVANGFTIAGPSGWNLGRGGPGLYADGDGVRIQGPNMTVKNGVIHDLWEMYADYQHTDCIQFWTESDGLVIENCLLGTWEPGGHQREIGPSQAIMMGTVPAGQNIGVTVRNCVFLGTCGSGVSINAAVAPGGTLRQYLYNNTFWSSRPVLTTGARLRNNVFKVPVTLWPTNMTIDSDYNAYPSASSKPKGEGVHAVVALDPRFTNADMSAVTGYGLTADFSPAESSPLIGRADRVYAPLYDRDGRARDAAPDIGAHERDGLARSSTRLSAPSTIVSAFNKPGVIRLRLLDLYGRGIDWKSLSVRRSDGARYAMSRVTGSGVSAGTYSAPVGVIGRKLTRFAVEYPGDSFLEASSVNVAVMPRVSIHKPKGPTKAKRSRAITFRARILPAHANGSRSVQYRFDRRERGKWVRRKVVSAVVSTSRGVSQIYARTKLPYRGRWRVSAYHADADHAATVSSSAFVEVR